MKNPIAKKLCAAVLSVLLCCLCGMEMSAQPSPEGPPGGGEPPIVPISGFLAIALIAGAWFGIKKLKGKKDN